MSEYDVNEGDLRGGGGNDAKPTGIYTGQIEKAEVAKDKNGKLFAKFRVRITRGKNKNGVLFENYLPLSREGNKYAVARRNSFIKALGLRDGDKIPGTPGAPDISVIDGTSIDVTLEHEYENVPGQEYTVVTRKGALPEGVSQSDVDGIKPSERVTWFALSDDFDGLGGSTEDPWEK